MKMRIVLASKSPRRRELLKSLFEEFEIITVETDEFLPKNIHPSRGVEVLAIRKGAAVAAELPSDTLVISADTLVEIDGFALGKPENAQEAEDMLLSLAGRTHRVHTGVAVHYKGGVLSGVDTTEVVFRQISPSECREYIATGEPMDKAGAYAIQGIGAKFVKEYRGEFDTVVGLGMKLVEKLVREATENE